MAQPTGPAGKRDPAAWAINLSAGQRASRSALYCTLERRAFCCAFTYQTSRPRARAQQSWQAEKPTLREAARRLRRLRTKHEQRPALRSGFLIPTLHLRACTSLPRPPTGSLPLHPSHRAFVASSAHSVRKTASRISRPALRDPHPGHIRCPGPNIERARW